MRNRFPAQKNLRIDGFLIKIRKYLIFASIYPPHSLNQDQGSVFTVRECAQSIPRLEKRNNRRFSYKNPKMFDFRFNIPTPFPESGSRKRFHASGMRGIDFSHKITPKNVLFTKILKKFLKIRLRLLHIYRATEIFSSLNSCGNR